MPVRFFGQFLVDEGLIEPLHLEDVADHTYYLHRTIGELAVRRGLMSDEDMQRVLALQAQTDRYYGELCIEQGLLTREQLEELLAHQRHHHSRVGEVLLELGHIDEVTLQDALLRYHADQAPYDPATRQLPAELQSTPADLVLGGIPRLALRMGGVHVRIGDVQPWNGAGRGEVALSIRLPTNPRLSIGLTGPARFGASLLNESRGSCEARPSDAQVRRALETFLERLARSIDPGASRAQWNGLPRAGFVFDFISTGGEGRIILDRGPE